MLTNINFLTIFGYYVQVKLALKKSQFNRTNMQCLRATEIFINYTNTN